jgi:5-methylcytosine-specific restriction endonuclease McrA
MFEAHSGLCCICKTLIRAGDPWIDEHIRPLALGGSNEMANRGPAHRVCAEVKTESDMERIVKAKAQKKAALGIKREDTKKIESALMKKAEKARKNLNPLGCPRPMFVDQ